MRISTGTLYSFYVLPMGDIDDDVLEHIRHVIHVAFRAPAKVLPALDRPDFAFSEYRRQFSAPVIIKGIAERVLEDNVKVLGVTPFDLFAPRTRYVFGEAQLSGPAAAISLYRLMDDDREKYLKRAQRESIHELGHTLGLEHCQNPDCVMGFSHTIEEADKKPVTFCERDKERLKTLLYIT